ncbi:hypothetical protein OQA88_9896 [Cercophora sp. LCS_1]
MWLINTKTLLLEHFSSDIPPYAILSHTWEDGEVSFDEMRSADRTHKKGYEKILQTCLLAKSQSNLGYAWIDTCCIDKSSSAELSEAINSMFSYYRDATVCYVYLADFATVTGQQSGYGASRWFSRGWTLQELIAPQDLDFFDNNWKKFGSKLSMADSLSSITGIPSMVLSGRRVLSDCSVAMRMSWAASRQTTRAEDIAYCLLGIFDVHMPLIYGEGRGAFRRLQEEIVKRYNDLSLFAWEQPSEAEREGPQFLDLFAASPAAFPRAPDIRTITNSFPEFSVTNKGLHVSGGTPLRTVKVSLEGKKYDAYALYLGSSRYAMTKTILKRS